MQRHLDLKLSRHFEKYKQVLILLGSRQVGKTTLVKKIFPKGSYFLVDNEPIRKILESYDIETYKTLINEKSKEIIIFNHNYSFSFYSLDGNLWRKRNGYWRSGSYCKGCMLECQSKSYCDFKIGRAHV